MATWNWLLTVWRRFPTVLHVPTRNRSIVPSTSETSCESDLEKLRRVIEKLDIYDLHDILRRQYRVKWCEWHLKIGENDKAIKIAKNFHQDFKKFKESSSIVDEIDTIEKTFLDFKPADETWTKIRSFFKEAREKNDPESIIKAYTSHQLFTEHLNRHSAVNTKHALELYCTLLNCPILAQTQEYTEAFTRILFHPKLDNRLVRQRTVFRGIVLQDTKLAAKYKQGDTIITTTFLSTSMDPEVARFIVSTAPEDKIGIFCTYNINNTHRRTALDIEGLTEFEHEKEILILRYVPFKIRSIGRMDDGRTMTICFDECEEHSTVEENRF